MPSVADPETFLNVSEARVEPFSNNDEGPLPDHPLQVLKALVLSIDWEISEDTVSGFLLELGRLQKMHGADLVNRKWFELLIGIGNYILKRKADIHPEAIRLLHAIFQDVDATFFPDRMPEMQRRARLLERIAEYNRLRDIVRSVAPGERTAESMPAKREASKDTAAESRKQADEYAESAVSRADGNLALHDAFVNAMEELRNLVQAEFRALRAEIRLWRADR